MVGRSKSDYSSLTQDEIKQACVNLGMKMSPYLAVEAHLVSCGGYATQGKGPFDLHKLLEWIKTRQATLTAQTQLQ